MSDSRLMTWHKATALVPLAEILRHALGLPHLAAQARPRDNRLGFLLIARCLQERLHLVFGADVIRRSHFTHAQFFSDDL